MLSRQPYFANSLAQAHRSSARSAFVLLEYPKEYRYRHGCKCVDERRKELRCWNQPLHRIKRIQDEIHHQQYRRPKQCPLTSTLGGSTMRPDKRGTHRVTCKKWQNLLESYQLAARVYDLAVTALNSKTGADFRRAWENAERARQDCNRSRAALLHHEYEHGCVGWIEHPVALSAVDTDELVLGDQGQSGG